MSMTLQQADQIIHPVETQWHYPVMKEAGFEPVQTEAKGLVRSYEYRKGDHVIVCTTGYSADHWEDKTNKAYGYWRALKHHVTSLK